MAQIVAPWTDKQVAQLNAWQGNGRVHPFTCALRQAGPHVTRPGKDVLVARNDGFHCPTCGYHQTWAHDFMLAGDG